ncbi:MAG: right-handed parallel beta-helix repeat-containing protein [Clostridia bacterium]|nr:right-handed parallel beta-helix repeat-containing protein [Clostridia bacterium]
MESRIFTVSPDSGYPTVASAQAAARECCGTVLVRAGVYRESIALDMRDSGCTYLGEPGAILTGGISVSHSETARPADDILARLSPDAAEHVRVIDLTAYGLTKSDWGSVYPIGAYHTASRYDDGECGINLEVFENDRRMTLARYPNEGYLKLDAVLDLGEVNEFPPQNYWKCNYDIRNPRGGTYIVDKATNERMKNWKTPETAWTFGYFYWDWADSSSPIRVNTDNRAISPKYVSNFGCRPGALYYLYNVLEELDAPGEFYLDRETGLLYVYPASGDGVFEVSISQKPLITIENADNATIDGFTLTCTRSGGITASGSGNVLKNLVVKNVAENGITVTGSDNTVENCEITRTGRGGIILNGGERKTLTPGNNRAVNNFIHDFSEVFQTYQAGISLHGVGNTAAHNEISHSPHMAIGYGGNEHLIEYNYIHDVVTHSNDAGAIYSGYDWCGHGTVIRYNLLRNIGGDGFSPDGIYWDDGLSGQTAYGNILIDVRKNAFLIGGGRDCVVRDNIIIGESINPISYDDRNRDGFVNGGWAHQACDTPDSPHWVKLRATPVNDEPWITKYPQLSRLIHDFAQFNDPDFPINPAGAVVENNVIINKDARFGWMAQSVYDYNEIGVNHTYHTTDEADLDPETLTFRHPREGFPEIDTAAIGRQTK